MPGEDHHANMTHLKNVANSSLAKEISQDKQDQAVEGEC